MIVGMWIRPAHRQKGSGRRLVEAGLDLARCSRSAEGDTWTVLQVNLDNGPARTLYEKMGFEPFVDEDGKVVSDCRGEIEQIWMKCVV
jgi:ribosomal protein S18 acetylase RimI-like enzyme